MRLLFIHLSLTLKTFFIGTFEILMLNEAFIYLLFTLKTFYIGTIFFLMRSN